MTILTHDNLLLDCRFRLVREMLGLGTKNSCFYQHDHWQTISYWASLRIHMALAVSVFQRLIQQCGQITIQIPIAISPKQTTS